ncbi:hypothetical protein ABMA09_08175 [Erwinia rhapontici]
MNIYIEKYKIKSDSALSEILQTKTGADYLKKYIAKKVSTQAARMPPGGISCEQTTNRTGRD